jgi:hypothetical protein
MLSHHSAFGEGLPGDPGISATKGLNINNGGEVRCVRTKTCELEQC